jgi:hypothetical protein
VNAGRRLLFYGQIVSDAWWGGTVVHCHDALLHFLVGNLEPLVLPQMLKPGFDQELFHVSTRTGGIDEETPDTLSILNKQCYARDELQRRPRPGDRIISALAPNAGPRSSYLAGT